MRYLFKWSGEPLGFIDDGGVVFDALGRSLGCVDRNGTAWRTNGQYLGELVDSAYILRNVLRFPEPPMKPRPLPPPPFPLPLTVPARTPRTPISGWIDPFDSLSGVDSGGAATSSKGPWEDLSPPADRGKRNAPGGKA